MYIRPAIGIYDEKTFDSSNSVVVHMSEGKRKSIGIGDVLLVLYPEYKFQQHIDGTYRDFRINIGEFIVHDCSDAWIKFWHDDEDMMIVIRRSDMVCMSQRGVRHVLGLKDDYMGILEYVRYDHNDVVNRSITGCTNSYERDMLRYNGWEVIGVRHGVDPATMLRVKTRNKKKKIGKVDNFVVYPFSEYVSLRNKRNEGWSDVKGFRPLNRLKRGYYKCYYSLYPEKHVCEGWITEADDL
jgi:hypothetical protein